jgi:hypothetical protein
MTFGGERFIGNRYQRLRQGAEVLAADPLLAGAADPFNSAGLSAFIEACRREQVLDGLTDDDADIVAMLVLVNFPVGLIHVADCLDAVVATESSCRQRSGRDEVDATAVKRAVAAALAVAEVVFDASIVTER